ncbi:hypothetical protein [Bradyrhizobium arachidis]|uniref:hypothetical protein n=1 Tax=Bradyrhizobium arachidis TaxID=858423 RepID=UPI0021635A36|nr:hypothetical protein [Bradyrhizobium arachidis]UVO27056.1 hypothetical protein KUF59_31675 [Bradyrhizobium arachidis]
MIATIGKLPLQSYLKSWERFSGLTCTRINQRRKYTMGEIGEISTLKQGHSFQEGLTALIASALSGVLQNFPNPTKIQVDFHGPTPRASINILGDVSIFIRYDDPTEELSDVQPNQAGDLEQSINISGKTIFGLGEFLRREATTK